MRIAVLPRDVAAGVITGSLSRIAWVVGASSILMTVPVLIDEYVRAGQGRYLSLPLSLLAVQLAALAFAAWRGRPATVVFYLLVGAATVVGYQLEVINTLPSAIDDYVFLLNRPAVALVLVGVTSTSTVTGILWLLGGLGVSSAVTGITSVLHDVPFRPGAGPFAMALTGVVGYVTLGAIQRSQRRKLPNFDQLEAETQRLSLEHNLARRTTAAVHDTLLNDLAIVMNGPDELDGRSRQRLRDDLDTLTSADWLTAATEVVPPDDQDAELRNALARIVSDLQWRGLTVQVTGSGTGIYRLEPEVADALVDAVRAALENVLRHSGASAAELVLAYSEDAVTAMVTDQGRGFDPREVGRDRLGLRTSIIDRIEDVGGRVDVWSSPGEGASIVMTAPVVEIVTRHAPSGHQVQGRSEEIPDLGEPDAPDLGEPDAGEGDARG